MLQQLDFFLSPFPPPVTWGQPVIHIFSFFPLPRSPPLLSPTPSSPPQPAMTSAVLPPLFPRAAGKGKAVVPDCLVAPSAPRVAPASGGFMADARRPPPPRRHAPRSPPPPRRPAPRSSPPPGQPAVRSPAAVGGQGGDGGTRKQRGKGDVVVSPFYWGLGKCYWGLRKNIGEMEIKNQFVGASFFTINPLY